MSKENYNRDLCDGDGRCKLYNPLQNQGQCEYYNEWCEQKQKIADLEAKLVEKEIERLREVNLEIPIKQMQFHHNQDKISFAVEQLEKVKETFKIYSQDRFYTNKQFEQTIDNQIKQLKEVK